MNFPNLLTLASLRSAPPNEPTDMSITIRKSETADTRTCDFANVSRETLGASSEQHIGDVRVALGFFAQMLHRAAAMHDVDKLTDLDGFHADFVTGFDETHQGWWERHRSLNRHHLGLVDGIPADVNLIDVLDYIADCVMAGMARSGSVYALAISPELLATAFQNTVALLTKSVVVVDPPKAELRAKAEREASQAWLDMTGEDLATY